MTRLSKAAIFIKNYRELVKKKIVKLKLNLKVLELCKNIMLRHSEATCLNKIRLKNLFLLDDNQIKWNNHQAIIMEANMEKQKIIVEISNEEQMAIGGVLLRALNQADVYVNKSHDIRLHLYNQCLDATLSHLEKIIVGCLTSSIQTDLIFSLINEGKEND